MFLLETPTHWNKSKWKKKLFKIIKISIISCLSMTSFLKLIILILPLLEADLFLAEQN